MIKRLMPGSAHDALDRMFSTIGREHGTRGQESEGLTLAADFLGVSHWTLRAQLDPDRAGSEISYARVVQLTRQFGCRDAAEHLAQCAGGVFLPLPEGEGAFTELSADMMREVGEALISISQATAPESDAGRAMSPREAQDALPLVRDVLSVASRLLSELQARAEAGRHG